MTDNLIPTTNLVLALGGAATMAVLAIDPEGRRALGADGRWHSMHTEDIQHAYTVLPAPAGALALEVDGGERLTVDRLPVVALEVQQGGEVFAVHWGLEMWERTTHWVPVGTPPYQVAHLVAAAATAARLPLASAWSEAVQAPGADHAAMLAAAESPEGWKP